MTKRQVTKKCNNGSRSAAGLGLTVLGKLNVLAAFTSYWQDLGPSNEPGVYLRLEDAQSPNRVTRCRGKRARKW